MTGPMRSLAGLACRLARTWWRQLAAVAAACAVVSTTIGGGLGVGDAIRAGLMQRAVGRLGRIDVAVLGDGFFRRSLAAELAAGVAAEAPLAATPAIVMPVTVAATSGPGTAARATLMACDDPAALGFLPPPPPLEENTVLLNRRAASQVGVTAGDVVVVRLPKRSAVPADSPLGRRSGDSVGRRVRVAGILPDDGLGAFSLRPPQVPESLVVLSLTDAQALLHEGDVANAVFVVSPVAAKRVDAADVRRRLRPRVAIRNP